MLLREWYAGRTVLLTGVTSELGRILLEKILRCLPDVTVYVLVRSRNGLGKEDRMKEIFASPGYERLRQEVPDAISRVKSLEGDLLRENLELSAKERITLESSVSVVFHAGGPHGYVLEYCQDLPKLKSTVTVSSIFRHRGQIPEQLQNEDVPADLPIAMVRLPLVGPAYKEPMPGFVETLKGSTAFMVGAGFAHGDSTLPAEIIPVDLAVNTMIATAWEVGVSKAREAIVYNATTLDCTWDRMIKQSQRGSWTFPYPTFGIRGMTSIGSLYWILVVLLEWLPSVLCDTVLFLCGRKQRAVAEYERVRNALQSLQSISSKPWLVERNRLRQLDERFTTDEREQFPVIAEVDVEMYVLCAAAATRKYCVQEEDLKFMKNVRLVFLFAPVMLVITYITLCHWLRSKVA